MAAKFRHWCGECGHKTPWLTESQSIEQHENHYLCRHPGIEPGGGFEIRRTTTRGRGGCLPVIVAFFLLLWVAATCDDQARSAPVIGSPPANFTAHNN